MMRLLEIEPIIQVMNGPDKVRAAAFMALARYLNAHPGVRIGQAVVNINELRRCDHGLDHDVLTFFMTDEDMARLVP